jgi:hypothetical protein
LLPGAQRSVIALAARTKGGWHVHRKISKGEAMEDQADVIKYCSSRRIFLKAAGVAGVGLALFDSETMPLAAQPSKQETTGARSMNPKTTAIVLIEYQNDFTTSGGVFHDGVKGVMQSSNMLANTV